MMEPPLVLSQFASLIVSIIVERKLITGTVAEETNYCWTVTKLVLLQLRVNQGRLNCRLIGLWKYHFFIEIGGISFV